MFFLLFSLIVSDVGDILYGAKGGAMPIELCSGKHKNIIYLNEDGTTSTINVNCCDNCQIFATLNTIKIITKFEKTIQNFIVILPSSFPNIERLITGIFPRPPPTISLNKL